MLYHLLSPLADDGLVFNLFRYVTVRMAGAALTAFAVMVLVMPWFLRQLREGRVTERTGKKDSDLLRRLHFDKRSTPTMGGLMVVLAVVGACALWCRLTSGPLLVVLGSVIALTAVGFVDDYVKLTDRSQPGLTPRAKFALQGLIGLAAGAALFFCLDARVFVVSEKEPVKLVHPGEAGTSPVPRGLYFSVAPGSESAVRPRDGRIEVPNVVPIGVGSVLCPPFFKRWRMELGLGFVLLCCLVMTASSNAVNLTDGLDGLATGCMLPLAATFAVIAYLAGRVDFASYLHIPVVRGGAEIAVFCSALVGGLLGFLWFNGHPAQIFLGDTGSLPLGGGIGVAAVALKQELLLVIAGGIFVAEALSVILQVASFRLRGKRIFLCSPLHHHFEFAGLPESKITVRFWIVGLLLAGAALATLKLR